jgi:heme-degrading monooxygenase HmoA
MYAVIGRVTIKPGHEEETRAMIGERGVPMLQGMPGFVAAYWSRSDGEAELAQHSFWLFDDEQSARVAEERFNTLRDMPDAPATFVSVDVCEVVGRA